MTLRDAQVGSTVVVTKVAIASAPQGMTAAMSDAYPQ